MQKLIIPEHEDLTEEGFKTLCKQIEIEHKSAIVVVVLCEKHGKQLGVKSKRYYYQDDMFVKLEAHRSNVTMLVMDENIIPVTCVIAEEVQEEKAPKEQLEELKSGE